MERVEANEIFENEVMPEITVTLIEDCGFSNLDESDIHQIVYSAYDLGTLNNEDITKPGVILAKIDWKYFDEQGGM